MGHSASFPCRHCTVSKDKLFDASFDIKIHARRQAHHDAFLASLDGMTPAQIIEACKKTGWRNQPAPLRAITFDACQQTAQDPMHLLLENLAKPLFLGCYQLLLTSTGQEEVSARFHALDYPRGMTKIPFPFNSRLPERFGMSQVMQTASPPT